MLVSVCLATETGNVDDKASVLVSTNCLPNMPIVHILSELWLK